jgi:hypothetical protein
VDEGLGAWLRAALATTTNWLEVHDVPVDQGPLEPPLSLELQRRAYAQLELLYYDHLRWCKAFGVAPQRERDAKWLAAAARSRLRALGASPQAVRSVAIELLQRLDEWQKR